MGIRTKVLAIKQALNGIIDAEINEQISELLDDIRILSDAKDDVIKQLGGESIDTSENSLHKHFVTHSAYQLCPKCNGQGIVSKPPWVAGDVDQWTSSAASYICDLCNGAKVIPQHCG